MRSLAWSSQSRQNEDAAETKRAVHAAFPMEVGRRRMSRKETAAAELLSWKVCS